jgi:hypothetical protein
MPDRPSRIIAPVTSTSRKRARRHRHAGELLVSNMTVHRIRLRGPWLLEPDTRNETGARAQTETRTVRLPAPRNELVDAGAGRIRLSRRFHCPTNLGPDDRVSIVVHDLPDGADVHLNGTRLGRHAPDIAADSVFATSRLEPTNLLSVEFDAATIPMTGDERWGEVALLISSPRN